MTHDIMLYHIQYRVTLSHTTQHASCILHHMGVRQYAHYLNVITASGCASGVNRVCIGHESGVSWVRIAVYQGAPNVVLP